MWKALWKMIPPLAHRVPRTSRQNLDKKKKHQDVEAVVVKIALLGTRFCLIFGHVPNVRFFFGFLLRFCSFLLVFCWSFWYLSNCLEFISSSMAGRPAKVVDSDNLARIRGWSWMSRLHNTRFLGRGDLRSKVARSEVEKKKGEKMEGKNTEFGRFKNDNTKDYCDYSKWDGEYFFEIIRYLGRLYFFSPRIFRCISEDQLGLKGLFKLDFPGLEIHGREGGNHTNTKKHEKDIKRLEILFSVIQGSKWCGSDFFFAIKNRWFILIYEANLPGHLRLNMRNSMKFGPKIG